MKRKDSFLGDQLLYFLSCYRNLIVYTILIIAF